MKKYFYSLEQDGSLTHASYKDLHNKLCVLYYVNDMLYSINIDRKHFLGNCTFLINNFDDKIIIHFKYHINYSEVLNINIPLDEFFKVIYMTEEQFKNKVNNIRDFMKVYIAEKLIE